MERISKGPVYQAYVLLKLVFIFSPIIAGLDKFFAILTDWALYLGIELPKYSNALLMVVGAIEVIVGISGTIDDVIKKILDGTLEGGESLCAPGGGKGYGVEKIHTDADDDHEHHHFHE